MSSMEFDIRDLPPIKARKGEPRAEWTERLREHIRRWPKTLVTDEGGKTTMGEIQTVPGASQERDRYRAHRYGPDYEKPRYFDSLQEAAAWVSEDQRAPQPEVREQQGTRAR